MTIEEFRQDADNTSRMQSLLENDPVFPTLMAILESQMPAIDLPLTAPEIASVRALSRLAAHQEILHQIRSSAVPFHPPADLGDPTFEPPTHEP